MPTRKLSGVLTYDTRDVSTPGGTTSGPHISKTYVQFIRIGDLLISSLGLVWLLLFSEQQQERLSPDDEVID